MAKEEFVTTLEQINDDLAQAKEAPQEEVMNPGYEATAPVISPTKTNKKSDIEIEIVDDTPPEDKGRKPMKTAPKEVDEIDEVNGKVQKRLDELKRAWHDERRAKDKAAREQAEALAYAKKLLDENKTLKVQLSKGEKVTLVGFGTFTTSQREARKGRNPKTGEIINISAKTVARFKAGSELNKSVN